MSEYQFDRDEWERYLRQGNHTLQSARDDMDEGDYDWACFKSQQADELFLNGFLRATGLIATGHSILKLSKTFDERKIGMPDNIKRCSSELDKIYIPSRYPDVYAWGAPVDYYSKENALESINCAERILDFVMGLINA